MFQVLTYIMYSESEQTAVATPPIMHQGLTTVSPPVIEVPASAAQSRKPWAHIYLFISFQLLF